MNLVHDQLDYTFQLPVFEGPLDLLLRLIEREELDITAIALAQVADQYLAHVRAIEAPDPAALSVFLVVAAKLLLIKSRALLPRPAPPRGPEAPLDEAEALARQLRDYQRFKRAAALLLAWHEQGRRLYPRIAPPPLPPAASPLPLDASLDDLLAALQRRLQLRLPIEAPPTVPLPAPKLLTVADVTAQIGNRLAVQSWLSFEDLLPLTVQRVDVIVVLWAVLELLKRRAIVVEQPALFGPIMIGRGPEQVASLEPGDE